MNELRAFPMTAALVVALGYFAMIMWGKLSLLALAAGYDGVVSALAELVPAALKRLPRRLVNLFTYFLGQKKFFKKQERSSGFMHAFIFWGFLVLQIRTIYLIVLAFVPDARLGQIHEPYTLIKDLTEVVVLAAVSYALYRRIFLRPKRLTLSLEGVIVLCMIGGLVATDLLYDGFDFALATARGTVGAEAASDMRFAIVGAGLAKAFAWMSAPALESFREIFYWTHIFIVLTFLNMLPGSKHFHVLTSAFNVLFSREGIQPRGALSPIEDIERQETFGVGQVLEFSPNQLLDGYSCTECGRCTINCPTTITGKPLNPKLLIVDIRNHLYRRENELLAHGGPAPDYQGPSLVDDVGYEAIWDCTTCRACSEACPVMIEHVDKIVDMRRYLVLMESNFPKELGGTLRNLEQKGNPWGLPAGDRTAWTDGEEVPTLEDNPDAEYIFWVGCAGAYDDQQKRVSKALVRILKQAGVSFAILGEMETCTGDPARRAGNEYLFQMLAQQNIETMKELGIDKRKLVTHCPHCFNTIAKEYPQFGGHFDIVHHSVLIERLISEGKVKPQRTPEGSRRVTYHDSCYIGRYNDTYEQPRQALAAIPGLELKEMTRNRAAGMCCGAGGARVWMEEHRGARINQTRVEQAMETQADTIAVACPFCKMMLKDGTNELGLEGVQTRDIAELIADSL
ncbi:MAG: (Fe-S)-binding protein [Deltaproteobacteria bacterium]|nr:(Fe-S)-binding protein [Deltaproteobacteria bacterium]MCB9788715.1 (Fe-S)-binding protein [Deltaproteobacteria bacterium]